MSNKIFVDSDVFVALAKEDDFNHQKALSLLQKFIEEPVAFFTSNYVFSECITIISMKISHQEAVNFIEKMKSKESKFIIERIDESVEEIALDIFRKQQSKNTSFVDCTNIALVKKVKADAIFSFDKVYKQNGILTLEEF